MTHGDATTPHSQYYPNWPRIPQPNTMATGSRLPNPLWQRLPNPKPENGEWGMDNGEDENGEDGARRGWRMQDGEWGGGREGGTVNGQKQAMCK